MIAVYPRMVIDKSLSGSERHGLVASWSNDRYVSVNRASLRRSQTQSFVRSRFSWCSSSESAGGYDYRWSLSCSEGDL